MNSRRSLIRRAFITLLGGAVAGGRWRRRANNPTGFVLTTVLGIAGAFLATFIGQSIGWYQLDQGAGFIAATVGAVIVLLIWNGWWCTGSSAMPACLAKAACRRVHLDFGTMSRAREDIRNGSDHITNIEGGTDGLDGHSQWHAAWPARSAPARKQQQWRWRNVADHDGAARTPRLQGAQRQELPRLPRRHDRCGPRQVARPLRTSRAVVGSTPHVRGY
jgi:uncharacterized membrane protein YeaQ/YmgE (transglycosylase-associated protein family)